MWGVRGTGEAHTNTDMNLKEFCCEGVEWIDLSQVMDK
jgi:hypothetical protein